MRTKDDYSAVEIDDSRYFKLFYNGKPLKEYEWNPYVNFKVWRWLWEKIDRREINKDSLFSLAFIVQEGFKEIK